jgi:uncharacterized protein (UPF0147 family)
MFNKNIFWHKNKQSDLMRLVISVFMIACMLALSGCSADGDEVYEEAVLALENAEYENAIRLLDSLGEHRDPRNIRERAENALLRLEVDKAFQDGRYASVITLLDFLPDFPESKDIREKAVEGVYRTGIIGDITNALNYGNFEEVLAILDRNSQFEDVTGFRQTAILEIEKRDAEEQLSQQEEIETLSELITEMFQIVSLEVSTRNTRVLEVEPGGFLNRGTITVVLEFDSTVSFGVPNPETIKIRRDEHILYVDASSINVEVLDSVVRNTEQMSTIRSNLLLRYTSAVTDQILAEITALEKTMAEQIGNELNLGVARRSFMNSFQAFCLGMGLSVVWENA